MDRLKPISTTLSRLSKEHNEAKDEDKRKTTEEDDDEEAEEGNKDKELEEVASVLRSAAKPRRRDHII